MFRFVILGLLREGEAYHGYALMKLYRQRSGARMSQGGFYRELQRLVAEGLLRTAPRSAKADPRCAPYEITDAGAAVFDEWFATSEPVIDEREDELSTRVLFLGTVETEVARSALDDWKNELWFQSKMFERLRLRALDQAEEEPENFNPLPHLIARRIKRIAADLEFVEELRLAYLEWAGVGKEGETAVGQTTAIHHPRRRTDKVSGGS